MKTWKLSILSTSAIQRQVQACFDLQSPGMANRCHIPFGTLVATTWVFYGATDATIATAKTAVIKILYHTSMCVGLRPGTELVHSVETPDSW